MTLALDERTDRDRVWEEHGLRFLLDPFAAAVVQDALHIFYNPDTDGFMVSLTHELAIDC